MIRVEIDKAKLYLELWRRADILLGGGVLVKGVDGLWSVVAGEFRIRCCMNSWETDPRFTIIRKEREYILDQSSIGLSVVVADWTCIEHRVLPELRKLTLLDDLAAIISD